MMPLQYKFWFCLLLFVLLSLVTVTPTSAFTVGEDAVLDVSSEAQLHGTSGSTNADYSFSSFNTAREHRYPISTSEISSPFSNACFSLTNIAFICVNRFLRFY